MKRQFFLDPVERDLLRVALEYLLSELDAGLASKAHQRAGIFARRRINELHKRLVERPA